MAEQIRFVVQLDNTVDEGAEYPYEVVERLFNKNGKAIHTDFVCKCNLKNGEIIARGMNAYLESLDFGL